MAALADITINDGAATPVARTFAPAKNEPGLVTYHDRSSGVAIGYPVITLGNRLPDKSSRNHKVTVKLVYPVLETAATAASGFTPGPTKAYELMFKAEWVIPDRASGLERDHLMKLPTNLFSHAVMDDLVTLMALPY
jgi:hypothetical protein